jgi:uncharacterized protein
MNYRAPAWLPGGQTQTIWPALYSQSHQGSKPAFSRERWSSPDEDFIDVDFAQHGSRDDAPLLVLFHGLEGSSQSHYAQAFANWARAQGLAYAVPHFRSCSGELNRAPRAYHSGDFEEIDWILRRMKAREPHRKIIVVGISLGGNALMRWAQEMGASASAVVQAVASVCSPLDLTASGHHIGRGLNRWIYTPMFFPICLTEKNSKPRAIFMNLTMCSQRRCMVSKTPMIIGIAHQPSHAWRRSKFPHSP